MKGQERIEAVMEQRWGFEKENKKEKSKGKKEESKDGPRESQEERTLTSAFCQNSGFILYFNCFFIFCDLNV